MADRPKFRYLVSVYYSDFIEADTEAEAIDALQDRVLGGDLHGHEMEWTIQETQSTKETPDD